MNFPHTDSVDTFFSLLFILSVPILSLFVSCNLLFKLRVFYFWVRSVQYFFLAAQRMKFVQTDAESLLQQIKRQEKQIELKRRWLLGLHTTKSERRLFKKPKFLKNNLLPESLLREDDMFYESAKACVERAFGVCQIKPENHFHGNTQSIDIPNIKRLMSSCLDKLTIKGLYELALLLTGGSVNFEKTRCKMKKIIRDSLLSVFGSKNYNHHQLEIFKQIFQLLSDPQNFHENCFISVSGSLSYHSAAMKILNRLKDLRTEDLIVMHKMLKGVEGPIPQLQSRKHGWNKSYLINQVKKSSEEMLSQLDEGDELQEPLAKAMAVADLSLKLKTGCHNVFLKEFYQFSPEVKSLQDDIMKAIWLVKNAVKIPVLRNLQLLVEPNAKIGNGSLRTAFVKMLTEFLFKCIDMNSIPKSLLQILDVIKKSSSSMPHGFFLKENIEEEVDCILSVSAQAKQVVLDLLPDHDFDQDFVDAYMEQLEESDDSKSDDSDDDDTRLQEDRHFLSGGRIDSTDSNYRAESIGEFSPTELHPASSGAEKNVSFCPPDRELDENLVKRYCLNNTDINPRNGAANLSGEEETESMPTKHKICKNQYLAIQDVCDETSILAYNVIGRLLKEFAKMKGLDLNPSQNSYLRGDDKVEQGTEQSSSQKYARGSALCQVTEELIDSGVERVKMLIGL